MAIAPTSGLNVMDADMRGSAMINPAATSETSFPDSAQPSGGFNIGSFLTEGAQIPQGSALKAVQSQTVLPEWYTNYAMDLLANQQALAQRPFPLAPMPRVAEFSPTQQQGFAMTGQAAGAYQPTLGQATQTTQQALGAPGGLATAQPYITQAGQTSVANIGQYMNPFQEQVVDRIGQLAARNLSERILPEVEGRYISAGQLGFGGRQPGQAAPSGLLTDTARAIRDTQEATLAQQAQALQSGYTEAGRLAGTDLSRFAGLGETVGGLARGDVTQQLAGAQQLAGMGEQAQRLGLTGAGALQQVGGVQQTQAQRNLDVAYEDFLRQQGYPQEQINAMLATFQGVGKGIPTGTQEFGIVPTGEQAQYKPSTAETIGGGLATLAGILEKAGVFGKGK